MAWRIREEIAGGLNAFPVIHYEEFDRYHTKLIFYGSDA
jgi:hypothetical protein